MKVRWLLLPLPLLCDWCWSCGSVHNKTREKITKRLPQEELKKLEDKDKKPQTKVIRAKRKKIEKTVMCSKTRTNFVQ